MNNARENRWTILATCLVLPAVLTLLLAPTVPTSAAADGPSATQFSGQATAVRATVLGVTAVISDTGPLPSSGGARETALLEASVPGLLTAQVLPASTVGQGDTSRSEASVASLDLTIGGNTIAADFVRAYATASCSPSGASASGNSELVRLMINGQTIIVSTEPNQTVALPNGRVILNEQMSSVSKNFSEITVNAIHVIVDGLADVVISSAHADVSCGGPVCPGGDFVTGGGWITGTPTGGKANLAVAGGIKNGQFWGHLTYIDHGSKMKVKGTGVTAYDVVNETTRRIDGNAEVNGQGGFTYQADVSDQGEPGRNDVFSLRLSNGYFASGTLGGGNIQLHMPCPKP